MSWRSQPRADLATPPPEGQAKKGYGSWRRELETALTSCASRWWPSGGMNGRNPPGTALSLSRF
ncbi:hypothetical protein [Accumulibacter sp.]|uniref:hypothetical protein n=1 Tax=Accumulibacter sp. TaxID=2053492 RepID=UPI0026207F7C|nr:hypothetical protein [Accumulibacter sp.]